MITVPQYTRKTYFEESIIPKSANITLHIVTALAINSFLEKEICKDLIYNMNTPVAHVLKFTSKVSLQRQTNFITWLSE